MDYQEIKYSKRIQTCFVLGNEALCTYNYGRTRYEHKKKLSLYKISSCSKRKD